MNDFEELQKQIINAHCAWLLFCNMELEIEETIKNKLPPYIRNKIGSIGFDTEFGDYMILEVRTASKDVNEVYASLTTIYPNINWEIEDMGHFSKINLMLADEVISNSYI